MKKLGSLVLTAVLVCGMAVPAFAEGANTNASAGMGTNATTRTGTNGTYGAGMNQRMNDIFTNDNDDNDLTGGNRGGARANNAAGGNRGGVRANNAGGTTRANAAGDNDVDWGWLGLAGLLGLAGMRGGAKNQGAKNS